MRAMQGRRPSPALFVAVIALVAALTGSAVALPGKKTVDKNDLKKGAVTKKALKRNAVTSRAIKDGTITLADLAAGVIPGLPSLTIPDGSISTAKLADAAVTAAKLADGAVTGSKIADGAVTAGKLGNNAVSSGKIADGQVGANDLADPEAVHVVGAPGEVQFSDGGEGDCAWSSVPPPGFPPLPDLGPLHYYRDGMDRVYVEGAAFPTNAPGGDGVCLPGPGEAEDGVAFIIPPGYRPENVVFGGGLGVPGGIVAPDEGATISTFNIPAGAVFLGPALSGSTEFRAAGPGTEALDLRTTELKLKDLQRAAREVRALTR